jgi:RNA polymerase sigma-70 factor, ECF subfamily
MPDQQEASEPHLGEEEDVTTIPDERLRLVFMACHPALSTPAQVALTLRLLGGLTTREIARLFLVTEPTMAARLTRAKRKIAEAGIPYSVPGEADLPEQLTSVLAVVYLIFTEGYAPTTGHRVIRTELCDEAIRLARLLRELMPDEPEVIALLALMLLQHARRDARVEEGRLVLLSDQDSRRWHHGEIQEGLELASRANRYGRPGAYVLQALIAAEHVAPAGTATARRPRRQASPRRVDRRLERRRRDDARELPTTKSRPRARPPKN